MAEIGGLVQMFKGFWGLKYFGLAFTIVLTSCGEKPQGTEPSYLKAHDTRQLMTLIVQPQAETVWRASGSVIDAQGTHDLAPSTEEGWSATHRSAATLTELGNLLQTPLYSEGRGNDWMQFSRGLSEVGVQAEKAVVARDANAIFEVGGILYNVCEACHQVYARPLSQGNERATNNDTNQ